MVDTSHFGLDVGIYGPTATPDSILGLAQMAEDSGFESIWLADHIAFPTSFSSKYPYSQTGSFPAPLADPLYEPIATMGVLAGATKRVKIGTAVLIIPYRNPVLLARMLATIDQFSGGRVILGAGVGWLEEEFQVMDTYDFAKRGLVTDEYLEIFKALSAGGEVGYEGETYRFEPVFSNPPSHQRPNPPVLIGGVSNPALRRAARLGDGWLAVSVGPDKLPERLAKLRQMCEERGRRFEDLDLTYKVFLNPGEVKAGKFGGREVGTGSIENVIEDLKAVIGLGFNRVIVRYRGDSVAAQSEQLDRFINDIIPKI